MAKSKGLQLGKSVQKGSKNISTKRVKGKRKADDVFEDAEGPVSSFFLTEDDQQGADAREPDEQESDAEEEEETAEQKRLRIAKAYLEQLRQEQGDDEGDFEGVTGGDDDAVAKKLQQEALEALGYQHRALAHRLQLPPLPIAPDSTASPSWSHTPFPQQRLLARGGHRLSVTCCCITTDEQTLYSVGKDGLCFKWDVASGRATQLRVPEGVAAVQRQEAAAQTVADWVPRPARAVARNALLACAVSSDGKFVAIGGVDRKVHVFDGPSCSYLQGYKGHQDTITCLAFRSGSHQLLSGSFDRQIKLWSLDDNMYVDTLYGHQAEVLCLDIQRAERAVSGGHDRTCRVWKITEESQLIFRAPSMAVESVAYVTGTEWVSGGTDGSVCLWSNMRKKPVFVVEGAHEPIRDGDGNELGAGHCGGDTCRWVSAVATCPTSDLVATAAGSGVVRFWAVKGRPGAPGRRLEPCGALAVRGFVSKLQFSRSGALLVVGVGQDPRLGRWDADKAAASGVVLVNVPLADAEEDGSEELISEE